MSEPVLKWKLDDLLMREKVTVYALNQHLAERGRTVSRTTLYRLANTQPERIDLEVAGRVLWGLEKLTGKHYSVSDLLEYESTPEQEPMNEETRVWMSSDLSRLGEFEPYEWEEGEAEEGDSVHYEAGIGLVVDGV